MFNKIKEFFQRIMPLVFIIGIPLLLCAIFTLIFYWDETVEVFYILEQMGRGSWFFGAILFVFIVIGAVNLICGIICLIKEITENRIMPIWVYLLLTVLSVFAFRFLFNIELNF